MPGGILEGIPERTIVKTPCENSWATLAETPLINCWMYLRKKS